MSKAAFHQKMASNLGFLLHRADAGAAERISTVGRPHLHNSKHHGHERGHSTGPPVGYRQL